MPACKSKTTTAHESAEQLRPKIWLAADSYCDSIAVCLGSEVGLRSFKVPQVTSIAVAANSLANRSGVMDVCVTSVLGSTVFRSRASPVAGGSRYLRRCSQPHGI